MILKALPFREVFHFKHDENKTPLKLYSNLTPVTFLPGEEEVPIVSPNQKYLAFLYKAPKADTWELRAKQLDKNGPYIIIPDVSDTTLPAWSFSSDQLAFHRYSEEGCKIYVARLKWHDTNNIPQRKVADCKDHSIEISFTWDKTSTFLYYSESDSAISPRRIYSLNVKTGKRVQITNPKDSGFGDYALKISPDGEQLYFMRNLYWDDRTEFYKVSPQGGEITKIMEIDNLIKGFTVDSAGQIIYSMRNAIFNYDPISKKTTKLITSLKNVASPDMTYDRENIFFSAVSDNHRGIIVRDLAGDQDDYQIVQSSREEWAPKLSHNENRFAFLSNRTGKVELYISNLDGSQRIGTRLPENIKPSRVRWSYDDRWLLFDDNGKLHLINAQNAEHELLLSSTEHADVPNWSRDNASVYFSSDHEDDWQVYRYKDGEISRVTEYGGYEAEEGPDGEYLYYTKFRDTGMWRMPIQGGQETQFLPGVQMLYDESFVIRGDSLVFKEMEEGQIAIKKLDLKTSEVSLITTVDSARLRNFSLNKDATKMLFEQDVKARESDVVVARAD